MHLRPCSRLLGCLVLLAAGCRDEQAGPRPRGRAPASGSVESTPGSVQGTWAGGAIQYLGTGVERGRDDRGRDAVRLTHRFQATQRLPPGWQNFVHLLDARTGQMVANADHAPSVPLEQWEPGRPVQD